MRDADANRPEAPPRRGPRWSIEVARVVGVPIRIHASFLLLLLYVWWLASTTGRDVLMQLALVVGVFVCVVLHELGHVLVARHYGIPTRDITLYPIGGLSRMERMGNPRQELPIALAGPIVSLLLGGAFWLARVAGGAGLRWQAFGTGQASYLEWLAVANLVLAGFNLLPAFPMDGGRALRAALALRLGKARATAIAARIGQAFAVVFALVGLAGGNLVLLLVGVFLFFGARTEFAIQDLRELADGRTVQDAMVTEVETLDADRTLGEAAERLRRTEQEEFPILEEGALFGLLTPSRLIEGLGEAGPEGRIGDYQDASVLALAPEDDLPATLDRLLASTGRVAVVVGHDGRVVGLLTWKNLMEYFAVTRAAGR